MNEKEVEVNASVAHFLNLTRRDEQRYEIAVRLFTGYLRPTPDDAVMGVDAAAEYALSESEVFLVAWEHRND